MMLALRLLCVLDDQAEKNKASHGSKTQVPRRGRRQGLRTSTSWTLNFLHFKMRNPINDESNIDNMGHAMYDTHIDEVVFATKKGNTAAKFNERAGAKAARRAPGAAGANARRPVAGSSDRARCHSLLYAVRARPSSDRG